MNGCQLRPATSRPATIFSQLYQCPNQLLNALFGIFRFNEFHDANNVIRLVISKERPNPHRKYLYLQPVAAVALFLIAASSPSVQKPIAERFTGTLDPASASQFSGILEDLDGCIHKASLDTSALPWLLRFPSGDSCGDPVDVPALMLELSPDVESSGGKVAGFFFNKPVCWLASGSGTFTANPTLEGGWTLMMTGSRSHISYDQCK
jgi:hypothetical protein